MCHRYHMIYWWRNKEVILEETGDLVWLIFEMSFKITGKWCHKRLWTHHQRCQHWIFKMLNDSGKGLYDEMVTIQIYNEMVKNFSNFCLISLIYFASTEQNCRFIGLKWVMVVQKMYREHTGSLVTMNFRPSCSHDPNTKVKKLQAPVGAVL